MKTARIPATGSEYQIGKIVCVARNYVDHIKELGNEIPSAPTLFMKPATSVIGNGGQIVIPSFSSECHHEAELAVLIGKPGKNICSDDSLNYVAGYGIAIDLTLRDIQSELKKKGLPWEIAKGFDTSCPLSDFTPAASVCDPQNLQIRLTVNGAVRQDGSTSLMINSVSKLISFISGIFTLEPGDVILTGTPAGVSAIQSGDKLTAEIIGVADLNVSVS